MPAQSRRSPSRPSRSQRRAGIQTTRTYTVPDAPVAAAVAAPRRTYIAEPTPVDHAAEFRAIRKDLRRILLWAALIIVVMIVLAFVL